MNFPLVVRWKAGVWDQAIENAFHHAVLRVVSGQDLACVLLHDLLVELLTGLLLEFFGDYVEASAVRYLQSRRIKICYNLQPKVAERKVLTGTSSRLYT